MMSGIIHKVKDALHHGSTESTTTRSTTTRSHQTGAHEGTAGPHSSKVANAADSRAESDFDNSERYGGTTGTGHTESTGSTGAAMTGAAPGAGVGSEAGHGSSTGAVYGSTAADPHDSNIANRVDPRVNSTTGTHTIGSNTGAGYVTGGAVYGTAGQTSFSGGSQSTNSGPHDSNVANKIDPRVDSDLDGRGKRHAAGGTLATPGSGSA